MRILKVAMVTTSLVALLTLTAVPAHAATISATDGASSARITTPIKAPTEGKCVRVPYTYSLDQDVDYAATVILDANGAMIARGQEVAAGTGSGKLALCGATLSGKSSPFTLQLMITYTQASNKGAVTAVSKPFTFVSKPITCKKAASPGKGTTKKVTTGACPKGWKQVQ